MRKLFIVIGIFVFVVLACGTDEVDEFIGLIDVYDTQPLAFLEEASVSNNGLSSDSINQDLITFSGGYTNIERWGTMEFSQENELTTLLPHNAFVNMLTLSHRGERRSSYYPVDTSIGELLVVKKASFIEEKINQIITVFFDAMKNKTIDNKLSLYVLPSEIPFISRQISRSVEYGPYITEVRVGSIDITDTESLTVLVRVIKEKSQPYGRADLRFYFMSVNGEWFINAIEGDFNILNEPYEIPGAFTPLGTTGVTQGF